MHDDGYVCRRGQELLQDLSGRPRKIQAEETWRAPSQASLTGRTCCGRAAGAAGGPAGVSAREVKHPLCRISEPGQRRQDPRGPSTRACPGTAVSTNLAFGAVEYAVPVRIAPPTARARRSRAGREGALTPVREAKAGWGQGQRPLAGALHTRVRNGTFRSSRRMPPLARAWLALACAAAAAATLVGAAGPAEHGALGAPSPPLPLPGVSAAAAVRRAGRHALLWAAAGGPERRAEPRGGGRAGAAAAVASAKHLGGIAADEQQPRLQSRGWALACPPALDVGLWASGGWLLLLLLLGAAGLPVGAAAHGRPRRSRAAAAGRRLGERRGRFRRCAEAAAAVAAVGCVALLPLMVHAQQSCPAGQDLSGSCLCNGATGSTGGGTDCLSLQGGLAWCYTDENACSDGTDSAQLASTEWSFAACTAAGACADCPAGRYKSTAGTAACIDCAAGKYIDVAGIDSSGDCINCAAGRYGAGGLTSSQCSGDCDAGRYSLAGTSAGPAGSDCIGCDAGRYGAGGSTTSQCSGACDAGRYSTASTSAGPAGSDCIPCAGGRYVSARGSDELSDCIDCAVGKYTVAAARTACISCAAGRYAAQQATTAHGAHDLRCGTPHGCSADDESARHDTDSAPHAVGCCSDNAPGSPMPAPVESFEQSSWTTAGVVAQNAASQNTWTRRYVVTPPTNTGPASTLGAYGGNYYLYTEASNNFNEDFILDIVPVLAANTGYTLGFWYHMHGGDTGTLSVEIADQGSATWAVRWFKTGEQQAAASDPWLQSLVRLTPTVDSTVRVKGVTGAGHESDMCIDAVQLSMGGSTPSVGWQAPRTETNAQQGLHSFCTVRAQKNEAPAADSVTRAHSEAVAYCTDRGARLCTALELEAGCLSGRTAVANQMVWSSSQTGCTGCEVGKYSAAVGSSAASACKHCDAGKYTNLRGSASCASCPVGRYDGTTGTEYCIECATGMYNAMIMITTCIACPAGELSDPVYSDYQAVLATATLGSTNAGAGACVATNACPAGKYAAKSNAGGYCNACPAGRYTATAGSTDVAGCILCAVGKYNTRFAQTSEDACVDCSPGKYVTVAGSDEASDCIACAAGKYVGTDDSCTVVGMVDCFGSCVPGCAAFNGATWNDEPSDCVDCAAGKYSSVSGSISVDDCTDCIAGKYGAVVGSADCIDCEVGKYVDVTGSDQMSDCIDCVAGKYIDVTGGDDASDCIACAVGKYANAPGGDVESDCISCPDVKRTTKLPGSNQALDCVCKDGYYESVAVAGVCDACTPVQDSTRGTRLWCTSATNSRIDECAIGYIRFVAGVPPNSGTADICDSDSPEARVAIVSSIDENLQDPSFISGLQSSPEVLTSYVRALESATSMGGQFTLAADAVDSAFGSMETLSTLPLSSSAADGLGSGVSNLLDRSTEIYAGGAAGSSDDAAATDQAKNRAGVVSGVLQRVALSKASADRSLGLDRSDLNTDMFQLAAHFPASVVGSTLSAGASSVALPPSGLGQDAQTVQTVQWSGAGPHFWAGSALSEELLEDTVLGSKVLTVNFFNGIGIGLNIVNLSQPVLVSLTVPAASARGIKPGRNQTVKCGYWDGAIDAWVADVDAVVISESEIGCSVTHFTDWAAFIGPPPKVNELGKLRDITKNPVGLVISLSMLAVSLIAGCYGVIDYRRFARRAAAPDGDALRKRYEDDAGGFAMHSARLLDTDIPWSSRAVIQLRRGWLGGSIFCPLRGDPWLRSQRLFTVLVQILLSLLGAAMFFQSEDELLEGICEGQAAGWDQLQSDDWCTSTRGTPAPCCEEENAILASLLTAACALPVIGAVNIAFGCLRQPLEADAMSKSGEQMSKLQESKISGYDNSTAKRRKRRGHGRSLKRLKRWGTSCKKCVVVQYQCCAQRLHKDSVDVREEDNSDTEITAVKSTGSLPLQQAPRARAPVCPRRKLVAGQMRTCAATIDYLFDRVDLDHSNTLDMEELRNLMSEISQGAVVREDDLLFVMQHAQRGSDDTGTIARSEVKQAISLWRYLQHERAFIADRFDEFDADNNGKLSRMELNAMMTSLNDGISVTEKEVDWVLRAGNPSVDVSDKTRGGLDADEARGALAMW